jgi:hypothetical protein
MEDGDDDRMPIAWGDMGAIALAAGVSLFTLWLIGDMLFGGHPLAALFSQAPKPEAASAAPTEEELRNAPMHLAPGEVRITIRPKPKNPPPKP